VQFGESGGAKLQKWRAGDSSVIGFGNSRGLITIIWNLMDWDFVSGKCRGLSAKCPRLFRNMNYI
jgi:hypothetical protein